MLFKCNNLPGVVCPGKPKQRHVTRKMLRFMKLTAILLTVGFMSVKATGLSQTINISCDNMPLEKVCRVIEKQTGYVFFSSDENWKIAKPVTVTLSNISLTQALNVIMKDQPLEYVIENKTVIISKKKAPQASQAQNTIMATPSGEIKGHISNEKGEPLAGANIVVKRTGKGTITDANGNFELSNLTNDDVITISYVGYQPQSIKIGDRSS